MTNSSMLTTFADRPGFTGRTEELEMLRRSLNSAISGNGGMVLIEGEAGIGKTRLTEECVSEAKKMGFQVFEGASLDYRRVPYLPFIQMLRDFFNISIERACEEDIKELLRSIEKEVPSIASYSKELVNFFYPVCEPVGGYRIDKGSLDETTSLLARKGYKVVQIRKVTSGGGNGNGSVQMVISTRNREPVLLSANRIEKLASTIKSHFESTDHLALVMDDVDAISDNNPRTKVQKLVEISSRLSRESGGLVLFSSGQKDEKVLKMLERFSSDLIEGNRNSSGNGSSSEALETTVISNYELLPIFFQEVSSKGPVLIILEDMQWGDQYTLNMVQYLARGARDEKIVILGTYRTEEYGLEEKDTDNLTLRDALQRMSREKLYRTITLDRLTRELTDEMAEDILGKPLDKSTRQGLFEKAEGNPRFIIEYISKLREEDIPTLEPDDIDIGPSEDIVSRRLASLEESERTILELASLMEDRFTAEMLQRIMGAPMEEVLDSIDDLIRIRFLRETEDGFRFENSRVRESVYGLMDQERREELHREVARIIESSNDIDQVRKKHVLAGHLYNGRMYGDAYGLLLETAKDQLGSMDLKEALVNTQRAEECLEDLEEDAKRNENMIELLSLRGEVLQRMGDLTGSIRALQRVIELRESSGSKEGLSSLHRKLGDVMLERFEWEGTIEHYLRSLHLSKKDEDKDEIARAFKGLGVFYLLKGDYHRSLECYVKYMEHPLDIPPRSQIKGMRDIGDIYFQMGDFNQALAYYKLSIKKGEEHDIAEDTALSYMRMANVLLKLGDVEDSKKVALEGRGMINGLEPDPTVIETNLCFSEMMIEAGELDAADGALNGPVGDPDENDRLLISLDHRVRGIMLSKRRDFKGAVRNLKGAIMVLEELQVPFHLALAYYHFGLIKFQQMDVDGALEMLNKASQIFRSIRALYFLNRTSSKIREVSFIRDGLLS
ncbi:MAG: AAA family ATPase [Thermoplasmatota archaeon]